MLRDGEVGLTEASEVLQCCGVIGLRSLDLGGEFAEVIKFAVNSYIRLPFPVLFIPAYALILRRATPLRSSIPHILLVGADA